MFLHPLRLTGPLSTPRIPQLRLPTSTIGPIASRIRGRARVLDDAVGKNADLVNQAGTVSHSIVPDRRVVLSHAELVVRVAESLDHFGARHAGLNDLLAFADDIGSLANRSADGNADPNANASASYTAEAAQANHAASAAPEHDEQHQRCNSTAALSVPFPSLRSRALHRRVLGCATCCSRLSHGQLQLVLTVTVERSRPDWTSRQERDRLWEFAGKRGRPSLLREKANERLVKCNFGEEKRECAIPHLMTAP